MTNRLRPEAAPTVVSVDALIDEAVLRTLEPAITALNRLFDAARPESHALGEPDGFDGLDRAGPIERLLATDWLLASEAPDEFLRRFEQAELGYLKLHRKQEQRPPTSLVLFDTGPSQLGLPRVAQLACLVVLSRRAARAGVELRFGTLADSRRWHASEPGALDHFVAGRTLRAVDHLPVDAFADDSLLVSPHTGPPYTSQQLVLEDAGDAVHATIIDRRRGTTTRQAVLPMPGPDDAVRLLRHPTGPPAAGPTSSDIGPPVSNLVFDEQGNKVIARIAPNRLALYPAPNSPAAVAGRIRYVRTPAELGVIAAAGRVRKTAITACIADGGNTVVVRRFGGSVIVREGAFPIHNGPVPVPAADSPLGRMTWADGRVRIHLGEQLLNPTGQGYGVSAADRTLRWGPSVYDVQAKPTHDGAWIVSHRGVEWWYRGEPPISPIQRWAAGRALNEVVTLSPDRSEVWAVGPNSATHVLYQAGERILDAAVHPRNPLYAVRTQSGRVVVRRWAPDETVYEAVPK